VDCINSTRNNLKECVHDPLQNVKKPYCSIVLERQPGADPQGFIGLEDEVDQHWDRLFMGAALSTVIGIGAELGSNANDSAIASALRQGSSNSLSQTGQQITQRNLNIQPTLTIRPGFPVRVIINRDLVLAAWQG
jgi:type IV secretion system protein TrbI